MSIPLDIILLLAKIDVPIRWAEDICSRLLRQHQWKRLSLLRAPLVRTEEEYRRKATVCHVRSSHRSETALHATTRFVPLRTLLCIWTGLIQRTHLSAALNKKRYGNKQTSCLYSWFTYSKHEDMHWCKRKTISILTNNAINMGYHSYARENAPPSNQTFADFRGNLDSVWYTTRLEPFHMRQASRFCSVNNKSSPRRLVDVRQSPPHPKQSCPFR